MIPKSTTLPFPRMATCWQASAKMKRCAFGTLQGRLKRTNRAKIYQKMTECEVQGACAFPLLSLACHALVWEKGEFVCGNGIPTVSCVSILTERAPEKPP